MSGGAAAEVAADGAAAAAHHVAPTEALLFLLTCILIGVATQYFLSSWVPVPYTAMLLVFGLAIGLIQGASPKTDAFTATLSLWMTIDPHLLLLIFLPTIGFSAALGQEPHLLRKNWAQILLLAWPGVVVTFLLIALCAKYFFPYGWSWPQALLFGAMLSATDPVAVVAVLHEVGADAKLASVIDGESLVNDGSALVIFLVLQQFVQGASLTAGQIVLLFLRLALVGAAMGLAFGVATSVWLSRIFNDPCLEIVLTLGAAYSCYFVSEELLGASGLLAVVVMGFSMSLIGGRHLTNRIKREMHAFWSALEWLANTVLFLWVGIALGLVLPPAPSHPLLKLEVEFTRYLSPSDAGWAVVLYLWLLVARAVAIGVFFPLLRTGRVGYAMTPQTAAVMVWAGLRGAVGVAMSLFILFDDLIESHEYKAHCVLHMALMAFATVLINGSTAKYVLRGLGLLSMTPQQLQVLEHVMQEVDDIRAAKVAQLSSGNAVERVLGPPDAAAVDAWTAVGARTALAAAHRRLRRTGAFSVGSRTGAALAARGAAEGSGWQRLLSEYSCRLLQVTKASYAELFQHMELGTDEVGVLQEAADRAIDAATAAASGPRHGSWSLGRHKAAAAVAAESAAAAPADAAAAAADAERGVGGGGALTDWRELQARMERGGWRGKLRLPCARFASERAQQQQACQQLLLVAAFVAAHTTAQAVISEHLTDAGAGANGSGCSGGRGGGGAADQEAQGEAEAARIVLEQSRAEVDAALSYAKEELLPAHPSLAPLLMSRFVSVKVLEEQRAFLEGIEASGLVKGEEVHAVQHKVDHRLEELQRQTQWHLPPTAAPGGPGRRRRRRGAGRGPSAGGEGWLAEEEEGRRRAAAGAQADAGGLDGAAAPGLRSATGLGGGVSLLGPSPASALNYTSSLRRGSALRVVW